MDGFNPYLASYKIFLNLLLKNSDQSEAISLYKTLFAKRQKLIQADQPDFTLEGVLQDMKYFLFQSTDFNKLYLTFMLEENVFMANLCLKILYDKHQNPDKKKETLDLMINNWKKERSNLLFPLNEYFSNPAQEREEKGFTKLFLDEIVDTYSKKYEELYVDTPIGSYKRSLYLKAIVENGNRWLIAQNSFAKFNTPQTFYLENQNSHDSKDYFWKCQNMNECLLKNGLLANILEILLKKNNICLQFDNEIVKIEKVYILNTIYRHKFSNPILYDLRNEFGSPMIKGAVHIHNQFVQFPFGHSLLALLPHRKRINKSEKFPFFLLDLTAHQFDIFSHTKKEFPFYCRKVADTNEFQSEDFFFGKNGESYSNAHFNQLSTEDFVNKIISSTIMSLEENK